jgi:predicted nuclease with TOPRIM domain
MDTIEELIGNLIVAAAKMEPMGDAYNALLARFESMRIEIMKLEGDNEEQMYKFEALEKENQALKLEIDHQIEGAWSDAYHQKIAELEAELEGLKTGKFNVVVHVPGYTNRVTTDGKPY